MENKRQEYREYRAKAEAMGDAWWTYDDWLKETAVSSEDQSITENCETVAEAAMSPNYLQILGAGTIINLSGNTTLVIENAAEMFTSLLSATEKTENLGFAIPEPSIDLSRVRECLIIIRDEGFEHEAGCLKNFRPFQELCILLDVHIDLSNPTLAKSGPSISEKEPIATQSQTLHIGMEKVGLSDLESVDVNRLEPLSLEEAMEIANAMVGRRVVADRSHRVPGNLGPVEGILQPGLMSFGDGTQHPYLARDSGKPIGVKIETIKLVTNEKYIDGIEQVTAVAMHDNPSEQKDPVVTALNTVAPSTSTKELIGKTVTAERKFHTGGNESDKFVTGEFIGEYKTNKGDKYYGIKRRVNNKPKVTAIKPDTIVLSN